MTSDAFTLDDYRRQMRQLHKLDSQREIMKMIPGLGKVAKDLRGSVSASDLRQIDGVIDAMTPGERAQPETIDDGRCRRISRGSGCTVDHVQKLLKDFNAMREMMEKMAGMTMMERMRTVRGMTDGFGFIVPRLDRWRRRPPENPRGRDWN